MADEQETAPRCTECHQWSDFEARVASILAYYGLSKTSSDPPVDDRAYLAAIVKIRFELERT